MHRMQIPLDMPVARCAQTLYALSGIYIDLDRTMTYRATPFQAQFQKVKDKFKKSARAFRTDIFLIWSLTF